VSFEEKSDLKSCIEASLEQQAAGGKKFLYSRRAFEKREGKNKGVGKSTE